jgi:hypothetical protein
MMQFPSGPIALVKVALVIEPRSGVVSYSSLSFIGKHFQNNFSGEQWW